jgi:hypothetical protein
MIVAAPSWRVKPQDMRVAKEDRLKFDCRTQREIHRGYVYYWRERKHVAPPSVSVKAIEYLEDFKEWMGRWA